MKENITRIENPSAALITFILGLVEDSNRRRGLTTERLMNVEEE